jgi:uncharacterized LabA/DUF88 family protein
MRRLRPVPERYDVEESDRQDGDNGAALTRLVEELRNALQRPKRTDDELVLALKKLNQSLEHSPNGTMSGAGNDAGPQLRLGVFADTANLTDRVNENPTVIDYEKLLERVVGGRRIVHARAYCPIYTEYGGRLEDQRSVSPVWGKGYDIVTKPVKLFADGTRKADLDLVLAVDVIRRVDSMDVMALLSGDGDFVPVVDLVREKGVRVEVYAFVESLAEELRLATDAFYDLHAMTEVHASTSSRSTA